MHDQTRKKNDMYAFACISSFSRQQRLHSVRRYEFKITMRAMSGNRSVHIQTSDSQFPENERVLVGCRNDSLGMCQKHSYCAYQQKLDN